MNTMQAMFESLLKTELSLPKFALRLIVDHLRDRGITLTGSQQATLQDRLKELKPDDLSLALEITDAQLARSTMTDDERSARRISLDLDADRLLSSVEEAIPSIILGCITNASDLIWKRLRRGAPAMLKDRKRQRRGFETRLARKWGRALDLLEMVREIAVEAGDDFNTEFRPQAATTEDFVFEVLTRLHARACQVASEVITLLRSGHADGAHARWRTLHEIAVVGFFVQNRGNDVAERYILHNAIESYRAALAYQEHCTAIGHEPLTEEEFARIKANRDALKARFGDSYGEEYGWAAAALGSKSPRFSDIERHAGLAHLRPYYKLASHNVHANPRGAFFKLGLLPDQEMLLAGPSDLGLADPGHGTAISLSQITFTLLTTKPNIDRLVICNIVSKLEHEVGDAFIAAHQSLEGAHH
jgi:Family of unknown function (DUF5677)